MNVVIIGGGAAGLLCAYFVADAGVAVTVVERNRQCGVKLNLTGKGRCNLTNDCDIDTLMKNMLCNGKFLYSAFNAFTPQDAKCSTMF